MMNIAACRLYGITNPSYTAIPLEEQVKAAVIGGCGIIQLRDKNSDEDMLAEKAAALLRVTRPLGALLIVNDSVYAAEKSGADGVHLGQSDGSPEKARSILGSGKIIGVTAKTVEQSVRAESMGADYLGCGAIFPSPTKPGAIGVSRELLTEIVHSVNIPVYAIGGISSENVLTLDGTGISGIAVVSGVFSASSSEDITMNARRLSEQVKRICI